MEVTTSRNISRSLAIGFVVSLLALVHPIAGANPMAKKEIRLARAEVCCRTLAELTFASMQMDRPLKLWFGEGAGVFQFADGARSYFHAWQLPRDENYYLSIQSHFDGGSHRFFRPRLVMLDAQFNVIEDVAPDTDLATHAWHGRFMRISVKPKREAAYLVMFSARAVMPSGSEPTAKIESVAPGPSDPTLSSTVRLSGSREVVFKISPEGKVVLTARPYLQDLD